MITISWNSPRTYVDGEVITAAILNTDHRDNLLALSTHAHSGAAGDGNDELSGVDSVTWDHISDPAAPGASNLRLYAKSGGVFFRDGSAGVATQLTDENHSHTFVDDTFQDDSSNLTTGIDDSTEKTMESTTVPTLPSSPSLNVISAFTILKPASGTLTVKVWLEINGVEVASDTVTTENDPVSIHYFDDAPVAGQTVELKAQRTSGTGTGNLQSRVLHQQIVTISTVA